jgi:Holliday junction resolvasome RuvABC endonuclease subunit
MMGVISIALTLSIRTNTFSPWCSRVESYPLLTLKKAQKFAWNRYMPKQGISSTWNFARAVGVISAVCELTNYPFHLVSPQKWKGYFGLTADKNEALDLARKLFPKAPLKLKKDINRAEALLIAEYWRIQVNGTTTQNP